MEIAGFEDNTSDDGSRINAPPPSAASSGTPLPPAPGAHLPEGTQTLVWKAEDANGDRLQYDSHIAARVRPLEDPAARHLDPIFVWDTTSCPTAPT